jgi:hypothetical protein
MNRPDTLLERPYLHWLRTLMHLPWPEGTFEPAEVFMRRLEAEMEADTGADTGTEPGQ